MEECGRGKVILIIDLLTSDRVFIKNFESPVAD